MIATLALLAISAAPFPGATTSQICGARTIPFQQSALASSNESLWLACRDSARLVKLGRQGTAQRRVELGSFHPWAVAAGGGSVWVISREVPELWRMSPSTGRRVARIALPATPAALWFGAGSAWVGFDGVGFARIDDKNTVKAYFTGDGVSAFAVDGRSVFAVSHRDNAITRVNLTTGNTTAIATGITDTATSATEEAVFASGSLWITGRGLDLLRVNPSTGKVARTIEIGPAGVDLVLARGRLIVASYSRNGARRGDPIVGRFATVDPATGRAGGSTTATQTAYLSGLAIVGRTLFAADTVQGRLVRLPLP